MRDARFIVLTGHLDDHPLPDLLRVLQWQRKTGRLQVEYADSPATFFFEGGQLVDARLGALRGVEALCMAFTLPNASFNFNPLIKAPERTVGEHEQKFVMDLLETPSRDKTLDVPANDGGEIATRHVTGISRAPSNVPAALPAPEDERRALPAPVEQHLLSKLSDVETALAAHSRRFSRERAIYAGLVAVLLLITFVASQRIVTSPASLDSPGSTGDAATTSTAATSASLTNPSNAPVEPARAQAGEQTEAREAEQARVRERGATVNVNSTKNTNTERTAGSTKQATDGRERNANKKQDASTRSTVRGEQVVRVRMRIERGRVMQAAVQNSRPGMESYEAMALRLARQRRYPSSYNGQETLEIRVKP